MLTLLFLFKVVGMVEANGGELHQGPQDADINVSLTLSWHLIELTKTRCIQVFYGTVFFSIVLC